MIVAVTRPADQLADLLVEAGRRQAEVLPLHLQEIRHIDFVWPTGLDPMRIKWLFFTSANGVEAFFRRKRQLGIILSRQTRIASVGKKTTKAIEKNGKAVDFEPSEAYGEKLFGEFCERFAETNQTLVYARAREIDFDPHDLLMAHGYDYHSIIAYESVERRVDPRIVQRIQSEDIILFTAPSLVRAYEQQFGKPLGRALAIGRTTAAEMQRLAWPKVLVMAEADIDRVWEYL